MTRLQQGNILFPDLITEAIRKYQTIYKEYHKISTLPLKLVHICYMYPVCYVCMLPLDPKKIQWRYLLVDHQSLQRWYWFLQKESCHKWNGIKLLYVWSVHVKTGLDFFSLRPYHMFIDLPYRSVDEKLVIAWYIPPPLSHHRERVFNIQLI